MLRNDPSTWDNLTWSNALLPGIQADGGICHLLEAWEVREEAALLFEGIHGTKDLLRTHVANEGIGQEGWYMTPKHWLHVDADGTVPHDLGARYHGVVCVRGMEGADNRGGSFQAGL